MSFGFTHIYVHWAPLPLVLLCNIAWMSSPHLIATMYVWTPPKWFLSYSMMNVDEHIYIRTYKAEWIDSNKLLINDWFWYISAHQDQIATGYYAMHLTKITKTVVFAVNNDCLSSHPGNKDGLGNVTFLAVHLCSAWPQINCIGMARCHNII